MSNETLTVHDLKFMKNLIEIVHKRGAFDITELSGVGKFYDKLSRFIDLSEAQLLQQDKAPVQSSHELSAEDEATARNVVGL